jgi:guanine nucleotide-binding protein subunit gamma
MSAPYEIRQNDTGKSKKQSMAELKLRRLTELNQRLQEDLNRRRIPVSEAAIEYVLRSINYLPLGNVLMLIHISASLHSRTKSPKTLWFRVAGAQ